MLESNYKHQRKIAATDGSGSTF